MDKVKLLKMATYFREMADIYDELALTDNISEERAEQLMGKVILIDMKITQLGEE